MSGTRTGKEVGVRALGRPLPGTERFVSEVEEAQGGVSADREAELNMRGHSTSEYLHDLDYLILHLGVRRAGSDIFLSAPWHWFQ